MLQDPYEKYFCMVAKSILAKGRDGGEGVFAVTDILEGTIVGFYNGIRYALVVYTYFHTRVIQYRVVRRVR